MSLLLTSRTEPGRRTPWPRRARSSCAPGRRSRPRKRPCRLAGATSDVSVLITEQPLRPGDTVSFAVDYDALVRTMTSPFVAKEFVSRALSETSEGDS